MKLVAYIRTSTAKAGNGDSPASQMAACSAWAEENGHEIKQTCCDRGVSGKLGPDQRPGLAAALVALEAGEAQGIVVHRLDRFARELHVQEAALGRAWSAGGRVFEAVEGEIARDDPDDPYRRFVRQVMGAAAELERGMVTARLRGGRRRKREAGGYAGGFVGLGQRVEGEGADAVLVRDDDYAALVERVVAERAEGATLRTIAEGLNADEITGRDGGRWYPTTVSRLLKREGSG